MQKVIRHVRCGYQLCWPMISRITRAWQCLWYKIDAYKFSLKSLQLHRLSSQDESDHELT
eukprot:5131607-Pleurochrysis_carterae.AAC.3